MSTDSMIPWELWTEIVAAAVFINNRTPHRCERPLVIVFQLSSPDAIYNQDEEEEKSLRVGLKEILLADLRM
ncbi:hypothetical protein M501DRAFT_1000141 [Patellaria atrata CBS 101060]|uniref:Uncharacterized protein n=1 Tax=Patellaria atrata CBS 101060 TaxID=1346257 RepID=A0A9P4S1J7_9PEZI|nr:hypothetical protein M501DRAFT_1000141 [Patellaria atrata CBS 101060]